MLAVILLCLIVIILIYNRCDNVENDDKFEKELNKELKEIEDEKRNKKVEVLRRRLTRISKE